MSLFLVQFINKATYCMSFMVWPNITYQLLPCISWIFLSPYSMLCSDAESQQQQWYNADTTCKFSSPLIPETKLGFFFYFHLSDTWTSQLYCKPSRPILQFQFKNPSTRLPPFMKGIVSLFKQDAIAFQRIFNLPWIFVFRFLLNLWNEGCIFFF